MTFLFMLAMAAAMLVGAVLARPVAECLYRIRHGKKMPY